MAERGVAVSAPIETPRDPAAEPSATHRRASMILNWLRDPSRTGQDFRLWEIAAALGMDSGASTAATLARDLAMEHREVITYAHRADGEWWVSHHYPDGFDGRVTEGLLIQDKDLVSRTRRQARMQTLNAEHAPDPLDRAWSRMKAEVLNANLVVYSSMDALRAELEKIRRGQ